MYSSRKAMFVSIAALAIYAAPIHAGAGRPSAQRNTDACAKAIKERPSGKDSGRALPMPSVCYNFDMGALGAPVTTLFGRLGSPDALSYSANYTHAADGSSRGLLEASYIFPRDLNASLARRGVDKVEYSVLTVLTKDGIVRAGDVTSFAGLHIGDPKAKIFTTLGRQTGISRAGDAIFYSPLPLDIHVNENTKKIDRIRIWMKPDDVYGIEGPSSFLIRNAGNKIVGVKLQYVSMHK